MCNVAGYIGNRRAANVLLDMMRSQEGFGGGYFSGIATVHNGRIHWAKVAGNIDTLCRKTKAAQFPGKVVIIHSRPNMEGDREWAHPFIAADGNFALIANGHFGYFDQKERRSRIYKRLKRKGAPFLTAPGGGPPPEEVDRVHISEMQCRLIEEQEKKTGSLESGYYNALLKNPSETVSLLLDKRIPGRILAGRFNQPLMVGASGSEIILATTALAFPRVDWISAFPAGVFGIIKRDGISCKPILPPGERISSVFPWLEGEKAMGELLRKQEKCTVQNFKDATAPLWPADKAPQKDFMVYEIVRRWRSLGLINFETRHKNHRGSKATATRILFSKKGRSLRRIAN